MTKKKQIPGTPEDAPQEDTVEEEVQHEEEVKPFACDKCAGTGLEGKPEGPNKVCSVCNGSGKASDNPNYQYPVGTTLIRQDGTFTVKENGVLEQQ